MESPICAKKKSCGKGAIEGNQMADACVKEGKAASEKDEAKSLRQNRV